jgi:hypothetical protein
VLEFKARQFDQAARTQAEDYALDLRDFHAGSRHHPVVPVLVVPGGRPAAPAWPLFWNIYDNPLFEASQLSLAGLLGDIIGRIDHRGVDIDGWEHSTYQPVPTIVEAAIMLYRKHGVAEIRAARADANNLTRTTEAILHALADAKAASAHIIVFVTGIPGAGKTLCGLNAVFSADTDAAFLTGTLPMVYVLNEALARDAATPSRGKSKAQASRETKGKIQSITRFLKDNRDRTGPPAEHVIVFDEAQRAWDAAYGARKFGLNDSEAAIVLDIMHRHRDYAVIVGLVGNGQEINTGEAGLSEWGRTLARRPAWRIRAAPGVINAAEARQCLFETPPAGLTTNPDLQLSIPIRQIRNAAAAPWVDAVLRGNRTEAAQIAGQAGGVPFFITRTLAEMRATLRARARGERRAGLVCSSGAKRLIADGLWPRFNHLDDKTVADWFLKRWPDVRASDALEIPATEFACQGLELDYAGLCWGGDFIRNPGWIARKFSGTKWHYLKQRDAADFRRNTYRVLLTRARYETIIWVPAGDAADTTREPALFDQTAAFLLACGATPLPAATIQTQAEIVPTLL